MPRLGLERDDVRITPTRGLGFACETVSPKRDGEAMKSTEVGSVLLLHGLNSHATNPNARAMAVALAKRGMRVISFDLPGHGACESDGDARGVYAGKEAALARARSALAATATERFTIVGSSMGGALAIFCANAMRGEEGRAVERVVLINPLMKMKMALPRVALAALRLASHAAPRLEVSPKPRDKLDVDEDQRPDFDDEAQAQCDADALSWDKGVSLRTAVELYDLVAHNAGNRPEDCGMVRLSFETPVLLITGGRDNVISPDTAIDRAKLAVQAGGKAEHVQFALAGHSLTLQSRREEVFDLVANWRWK